MTKISDIFNGKIRELLDVAKLYQIPDFLPKVTIYCSFQKRLRRVFLKSVTAFKLNDLITITKC